MQYYKVLTKWDTYDNTVDSELGVGAECTIYLEASPRVLNYTEQQTYNEYKGSGTILLMDDEDMVCDVAGEMLKSMGYNTLYANDGVEAIELYKKSNERRNGIDLVILDLTVPGGMGGKETIKCLKEINPDIKAIVSSGYFQNPVMSKYSNDGFKGFVVKPYKSRDLGKEVTRVLT